MENAMIMFMQTIEELQQELNPNYFNCFEAHSNIKKDQKAITEIMNQFDNDKKKKKFYEKIKQNYLEPHPDRMLVDIECPGVVEIIQTNKIEEIIIPKTQYSICFNFVKMYPLMKPYSNIQYRPIITPSFNISLHHLNKTQILKHLRYSKILNLHRNPTAPKNRSLVLKHIITEANYQTNLQLFKNSSVHLLFQSQNRIIVAESVLDFEQLLIEGSCTKNIDFYKVGSKEILFSIQTRIVSSSSPLPPDVRDLPFPPKRVLSKSPSKSRSPSPKLHKNLAKTVSHPQQRFFQVYNKVKMTLTLPQKIPLYEGAKVVIEQKENISTHSFHLQQHESSKTKIKVTLILYLQVAEESGHIYILIADQKYYIKVLPNNLFSKISIIEAKNKEKSELHNFVVMLTENCHIRPDDKITVSKHPMQITATINCINSFLIKTDHQNIDIFLHPIEKSSFYTKKEENGFNVYFVITEEDLKGLPQPEIANKKNMGEGYFRSAHIVFTVVKKVDKKEFVEIQSVLCHFKKGTPGVNLTVTVAQKGSYLINLSQILQKDGKFRMRSYDNNIIKVQLQQFEESTVKEYPVFVTKKIGFEEKALLFLDDLDKNLTCIILVKLVQIKPKFRYK